jgi:DNA-binding transcriptional LysR family regulator
MALTISQLRAFKAVAEHGSLRAASRALGVAQSGITQQLQNLESILGATLFIRTNRGIALTALGQRLLQRAGAIIGECERAEQEVQQLRGDYAGEVTFGMTTEPLVDALAPVLMDFRTRFPQVALHLRTGTSRMMISWIREGTLDFAVALVSKHTDTADLSVVPLYLPQGSPEFRRTDARGTRRLRVDRDALTESHRRSASQPPEPSVRKSWLAAA